ncbi:MAG: hypothetical protein ACREMY_20485, partial [bacterium]
PYFIGMWLVSWLGPSFSPMNGIGVLGFFTGMWLLVIFSLMILFLAIKCGQHGEAAQLVEDLIKNLASRGIPVR